MQIKIQVSSVNISSVSVSLGFTAAWCDPPEHAVVSHEQLDYSSFSTCKATAKPNKLLSTRVSSALWMIYCVSPVFLCTVTAHTLRMESSLTVHRSALLYLYVSVLRFIVFSVSTVSFLTLSFVLNCLHKVEHMHLMSIGSFFFSLLSNSSLYLYVAPGSWSQASWLNAAFMKEYGTN